MAAADAATKPLVVFIVFFGELPPWLPLTLTSMAMNARVQFVVVGDAAPPPVIPQNVRFEQISYPAMQSRLAKLIEADVKSPDTKVLRFALPDGHARLHAPLPSCLKVRHELPGTSVVLDKS